MYWWSHSHDETEGRTWGGKARHGQWHGYLSRGRREDDTDRQLMHIGLEWAFFWPSSTSLGFTADPSDSDWMFHAAIWRLFSVFVTLEARWLPQPKTDHYDARSLGLSLHDGAAFWEVWKDPHSWSKTDGWRNDSWNWSNWLLGRPKYSSTVVVSHQDVPVPMPEGVYRCQVELTDDRWTRKRGWGLFDKRVLRATVKPNVRPDGKPGYIPHPGKWGGEDGLYEITCQAATLADAVAATVRSVLAERVKRGGQLTYTPPEADT